MKNAKRYITLLLVLVMLLSMTACGTQEKSAAEIKTEVRTEAKPEEISAPAADVPAELVYTAEVKQIEENVYGQGVLYYTAEGVYTFSSEKIGSTADPGVVENYPGQFDITARVLNFISYDGSIKKLEGYKSIEPSSGITEKDGRYFMPDGAEIYSYDYYQYISGLVVTPDGNLICSESVSESWTDIEITDYSDYEANEDHYKYSYKNYVRELNPDGSEKSCFELPGSGDIWYNLRNVTDKNGNLIVDCSDYTDGDYRSSLIGITPTGETKYSIPLESYLDDVFATEDGALYAVGWGAVGRDVYYVDIEKAELIEAQIKLPDDAYQVNAGGGDYSLYYTSGTKLYGIEGGKAEPVLDWVDCDISPDNVGKFYVAQDGTVRVLVNRYWPSNMTHTVELITVKKAPKAPEKEKTVLTLGVQYAFWNLWQSVTEFNRSHDDVRISVIDYSQYNTEEDYSAGITKMNTEIMAGNGPDIISLGGLNTSKLAARGLLEDLYPYIDKDPDMHRDDFLPSILKAAEQDGKLVQSVAAFSIQTVAGAKEVVGDRTSWTYDDLYAALADMPEGCDVFDVTMTRNDVLSNCLAFDMNRYISWNTGKVSFDTGEFAKLLEFAGRFPAEYNWEDYDWEKDSTEIRIRDGQQMLYSTGIWSLADLELTEAVFGGKEVSLIGMPTLSGSGTALYLDTGDRYAISSTAKDKEAAWSFVRYYFTEDAYANIGGLPVIKTLMERQIEEEKRVRYMLDNKGHYVLDANGEKIPEPKYYGGEVNNGVYALSEDLAQQFEELVNSGLTIYNYDDSIISIVREQSEAFFAGQKSAEEVARLVQSKINIYVNEQR